AIIIKAVEDVTMFILQPRVLRTVIDERSTNTGYILMIQDHIGESMIMQREEFYLDFAKKINDRSQRVSVDVVEKLKQALVAETRRRCDAERERERAVNIIYQLLEKIKAAGLRPDAGVEAPVPPSYPRVTPPSILPRPPTPPIPRMAAPL